MNKAEAAYKRAEEQDIKDPALERIQRNLLKQYKKMYMLDEFNIAILDPAANDPGTGSGWKQSKQNWALHAVEPLVQQNGGHLPRA